MDKINIFKKEFAKSAKKHLTNEIVTRVLRFAQNELNILFNSKINQLKKKNNDYTIQPQHDTRKSKNHYSLKRIR